MYQKRGVVVLFRSGLVRVHVLLGSEAYRLGARNLFSGVDARFLEFLVATLYVRGPEDHIT